MSGLYFLDGFIFLEQPEFFQITSKVIRGVLGESPIALQVGVIMLEVSGGSSCQPQAPVSRQEW